MSLEINILKICKDIEIKELQEINEFGKDIQNES